MNHLILGLTCLACPRWKCWALFRARRKPYSIRSDNDNIILIEKSYIVTIHDLFRYTKIEILQIAMEFIITDRHGVAFSSFFPFSSWAESQTVSQQLRRSISSRMPSSNRGLIRLVHFLCCSRVLLLLSSLY
jgi:hypothetical protein